MWIRTARLVVASLLAASASFGYYHWVHYAGRTGPFNGIVEKFDLSALPDKTITYQISDNGPSALAATDSFALVVSQIRAAAKVWSDIETSDLRLKFGGIAQPGSNANASAPSIDVVFEEMPPGLVGYGGPQVRNDVVTNANGTFIPIQRAVVAVSRNLTNRPSWSERMFQSVVHDFGHALGLQHSFSSGAMATEVTRATTKIRPILPDDVIGVSLLYPSRSFRDGLGSISGRITAGSEGIGLASVVAIAPGGFAIGTLTHPGGTYRIEGLPPGQYFVYAHPLPPTLNGESTPGNVVLPVDAANQALPGGQQFDTMFYPASRQPFVTIAVSAGNNTEGINFNVNRRNTAPPIHSVQTYSFPGQIAVKPAHAYMSGGRNLVVISGAGLIQGNQPAPGLQVSAIGGALSVASGGLRPYSPAPESFLQVETQFGQFAAAGPVHLIFSRGTDIYVLPNAIRIVERAAPLIESITHAENGDAVLTGNGLQASTRIAFDGSFATFKSFDEGSGRLTVTPPPGPAGVSSHVAAFNTDGQSNLFLQQAPVWNYDGGVEGFAPFVLSTSSLPAGTESMIEISGSQFSETATSIAFGSPDVVARKVWFLSANRMMANVYVAPGAAGRNLPVTIANGLRLNTLTGGLQITSQARPAWLSIANGGPVTAGASATIQWNGPALSSAAGLQVSINDRPLQVLSVDGSVVTVAVPANLPSGVGVLRLISGNDIALPLAVQVQQPPAIISSVTAGFGILITPERPARYGELTNMLITGLPDGLVSAGSQPRVTLTIGGVEHRPLTVNTAPGLVQLQFTIQAIVPQGLQPVNVTVEGLQVQPMNLPVRSF
jgi:uncharacterized protein (TIGR03437 family)